MTKTLLVILVFVLILAGVYFAFYQQINNKLFTKSQVSPDFNQAQSVTSPTPTVAVTSTSAEDDLTALEKELNDLNNSDAAFVKDLNNL